MKILQINNNHFRLGGAETVYLNTIKLLKDNNHQVVSFSRSNPLNENLPIKEYFIEQSNFFLNRFYSKHSVRYLKEILESEKPDIVHIHSIVGGITFSILPIIKKFRIPIVKTIHDFRLLCPAAHFWNGKLEVCEKCAHGLYYNCLLNNCSPEGNFRSLAIATESYLRDKILPYNKYIDSFIFVSNFAKDKFIEYDPNIESKSFTIYNYTNNFESCTLKGNYYLYLGRLQPEKGIMLLIDAFEKLPNIKLKIVGDGILYNKINHVNLKNVELLGYKLGNELQEIIKNSSFNIVPSECYETLSMSAIEALAFGKPIIGSDHGGLSELIKDGVNGYKFKPSDINDLIKIINQSNEIKDKEYINLSLSSFNFAKENFNPKLYYDKLMNAYEHSLVGNK